MSDTFPDETLYPVLTSLADEDRIFASNSAAGHESSQIKGSVIKAAAIAALKGTPPATLDTLQKLAAAINDDPNFHSTLTTALAGKAPLASPALTGTPTAPMAAAGTNTNQIANCAFVTGAVAGVTASSIGLGSVDNTADSAKPVSTAQAAAIAASRPKHAYTGISGSPVSIAAERGNTYGINANGCTLTLPDVTTSGYVDGDEICVLLGVTNPRTLTITSPSWVVRGSGRQPENTPFNLTGLGTFISFTRCTNQWSMSSPEYELAGKAPLASPVLTGTPTAPTPAPGTNTTQLATTAFCAAGFLPRFEAVVERTAATTAEPNKLYVNVKDDSAENTLMLTLPSPTGNAGKVIGLTSRYRLSSYTNEEANWQLTGHIDGIASNTYWQGYWELGSALLWCDGTTWHMLTDWRAEQEW